MPLLCLRKNQQRRNVGNKEIPRSRYGTAFWRLRAAWGRHWVRSTLACHRIRAQVPKERHASWWLEAKTSMSLHWSVHRPSLSMLSARRLSFFGRKILPCPNIATASLIAGGYGFRYGIQHGTY